MRIQDWIRLFLLGAIWGASFLFMRIAVPQLGAIGTAFWRVLLASIGLSVLLLFLKAPIHFEGKWRPILLIGVINSGLPFLLYCFAAQWLPTGYSSILNATTPLMGILIGFLFFHEQTHRWQWTGVLLGLISIIVISTSNEIKQDPRTIVGCLMCLGATACYGLAGFLTRQWINQDRNLDPKTVALGSQIGATLFLLPFFAYTVIAQDKFTWPSATVGLSVLLLGLICTAWAYIIFFKLLRDIGPLNTLTVTFLIPPFGIIWGYLFLNETISLTFFTGGILICLAVFLVTRPTQRA
ncbi:DMT family transporter [Snodgrassella sp. CFCC 13594]|uniref:DMT family transporter n=1 Tax=Snodgrassella sp. CFCC 13594 TaxID=1775559 RepID=UPI00082D851A|nr:DMT family transporter [Snodgrassella sp. CFCC 13594]